LRRSTKTSNSSTPRLRLKEAGHTVEIIGPKAGETYVGKHGYPQKSEKACH
jgi:putative intracellular protease/amidase